LVIFLNQESFVAAKRHKRVIKTLLFGYNTAKGFQEEKHELY